MRRGPPRRRIGRCDELGRHLGCGAERGIIEDGEIFLDRAACRVRRQTRGTLDAGAVAGIGLDQAGIDGEAFAADEAFGDWARSKVRGNDIRPGDNLPKLQMVSRSAAGFAHAVS